MTLLWRNAIPCVTKKKVFILVECVYSWVQVVLIYDFKEMGDILKTSGAPWWPHEKVTSVHRLFSVSPAHHSSATPHPSNTLLPWRCHWWGSIWTSNPVWCCRSPSGPETHTPSVQRHYDVSCVYVRKHASSLWLCSLSVFNTDIWKKTSFFTYLWAEIILYKSEKSTQPLMSWEVNKLLYFVHKIIYYEFI